MVATYTTNKTLTKPANGDNVDTWDVPVNLDWDLIDTAFGGSTSINVTAVGVGPTALTVTQYRPPVLLFTGTLSNAVNYQLPSGKGGVWVVNNATSGAFNLVISSAGAGTTVTVPQGEIIQVYCDGTNVKKTYTVTSTTSPGGSNTQVQFNSSGAFGGSAGFTFDGTAVSAVRFTASGSLRVSGATSGYVGLAASAVSTNVTWTLPASDGTSGQLLQTDGAAVLSWATPASASTPAGVVLPYAGSSAPTGYLLCGGQAVDRTTYATLFAVTGTVYGVGDGTTTFNVPDLRGRVAAGLDNMNGSAASRITNAVSGINGTTLGASGGDQNLQSHSHSYTAPNANTDTSGTGTMVTAGGSGSTTGTTGSGSSQNVQPTMMLNYIIKT
jgi:microcystin-dependent protein